MEKIMRPVLVIPVLAALFLFLTVYFFTFLFEFIFSLAYMFAVFVLYVLMAFAGV